MSVEYQILNPSGNITALVTNDYPREKYQEISSKIMQSNSKIEQVGFLKKYSDSIYRIEMSGLEFCGNASLAFACFLVKEKYESKNNFEISVSGYDDLIECNVEQRNNNYYSTIDLKLNKKINDFIKKLELNNQDVYIVNLPGISHLLLDQTKFIFNKNNCLNEAKNIINELKISDLPAAGVIWYDKNQINPVVYVRDIDSLFCENSCGSGSIAYGIYHSYLKKTDGKFKFNVVQKNKEIVVVEIELKNDIIISAKLSGSTTFNI